MANIKISEMADGGASIDGDAFPVARGSSTTPTKVFTVPRGFASVAALNTAIAAEKARITAGSPRWQDGTPFLVGTEKASRAVRIWDATLQNARTVRFGAVGRILSSDTATVLSTTGFPANATGADGDMAVDWAVGVYFLKASGAWSVTSVDGGAIFPTANPSSKYLRFYPFKQYNGTGLPRDYSTNAKSLYPMTGYAESSYWGTAGVLTTAAAANSGLVESTDDLNLSITDTTNLLIAFEITKAAPTAEEGFMGWSSVGTSGVRFYATTAGKLKIVLQDDQLSTSTLSATTATVFDGTPHSVQIFFNNKINAAVIAIDGMYERLFDYSSSSRHKTIPMGDYFGIGATYGKDQTTVATQIRGLHLVMTDKLPSNLGMLFYRLSGPQIMNQLREGEI